jgi:ribosomal protein S18 acetylase RimI-like enzyme
MADPKRINPGVVSRRVRTGTALMRECIRRALKSGAATLTLHTTDIIRVAMHMYERISFVRDPEREFHPDQNVTVKGYRLKLSMTT